jgi:hypothetical protein
MAETEKKAAELINDLATADQEEAQAILTAEQEKGEQARSTVIQAAEERLAVLAVPGEPQEGTPSGVWAQLLDDSGEPVKVDGQTVRSELVT